MWGSFARSCYGVAKRAACLLLKSNFFHVCNFYGFLHLKRRHASLWSFARAEMETADNRENSTYSNSTLRFGAVHLVIRETAICLFVSPFGRHNNLHRNSELKLQFITFSISAKSQKDLDLENKSLIQKSTLILKPQSCMLWSSSFCPLRLFSLSSILILPTFN